MLRSHASRVRICRAQECMSGSGESEEEFSSRLADNLEELILKEGPDTVCDFSRSPCSNSNLDWFIPLPPIVLTTRVLCADCSFHWGASYGRWRRDSSTCYVLGQGSLSSYILICRFCITPRNLMLQSDGGQVQPILKKYDILLIADEVTKFEFEHSFKNCGVKYRSSRIHAGHLCIRKSRDDVRLREVQY